MKKIILNIIIILIVIGTLSIYFLYKEPKVAVLCYHNIATKAEKEKFLEEKR